MTYNANNIFPQKDVKDMQKLNVWNNNILESLNYNGLKEITIPNVVDIIGRHVIYGETILN